MVAQSLIQPVINDVIGSVVQPQAAGNNDIQAALAYSPDMFYSPFNKEYCYQDESRTTLVTATNDPIANTSDLSGNDRHIAIFPGQTAERGLWDEGAKLDGGDDAMRYVLASGQAQPITEIAALKILTVANNRVIFGAADAGFLNFIWINSGGNLVYAASTERVILSPANTNEMILTVVWNGINSIVRVNGVDVTPGSPNPGTEGSKGIVWGANFLGGANGNVIIRRHFKKFAAMSVEDIAAVEALMDVKGVL